jgi:DNA gyrase subunit B
MNMSEEIIVLSDKDSARKRINVFHGSANNFINMIKELIGNSLDVFDNSITNTIDIVIQNSNQIEYTDSGYGIPLDGIANNKNQIMSLYLKNHLQEVDLLMN